tara:strand:- start:429 stop:1145 length:717 start_codon:yes stop_codon:yes gene_type:complete
MLNTKKNRVLVIIPAFNEAKFIGSVLAEIADTNPNVDILVIDDGSTDATSVEVRKLGVSVLRHPFNLGYGSAVQTGYMYAVECGYEYLVQIDADGQHNPKDIPKLLKPILDGELDITMGSRFLDGNSYTPHFARMIGIRILRLLTQLLCNVRVTDPTTGYQAMNSKVLRLFSGPLFPKDYPDADVLILLVMSKFRFKEVPVNMFESKEKKSMHGGIVQPIYYMFKMILSMLLTRFRKI